MKVLVNTPNLNKEGGVASYYSTLRLYYTHSIDYFTVGKRTHREPFFSAIVRFLYDYCRFIKKLNSKDYDIVNINPSFRKKSVIRDGLFLLIAKMFKKKVIIFFHGWDLEYEQALRLRWLWLFRRVYFRADAFIVLAKEFRNKLIKMGYDKKIYIETTAVDDTIFDYIEEKKIKKYSKGQPFNIIYLSRIEKNKGIYETLDAYAIVKQNYPETTLTVAGNGDELKGARTYTDKRNLRDVTFLGYLRGELKSDAFINASCYLLPTYGEGMPNSILEAMAFGLPVLTRSVGGIVDFFVDGKMGFITNSKNPQIFANYIKQLIEKPELQNNISEYNHAYAKEHFIASKIVKRIENYYSDISNR